MKRPEGAVHRPALVFTLVVLLWVGLAGAAAVLLNPVVAVVLMLTSGPVLGAALARRGAVPTWWPQRRNSL